MHSDSLDPKDRDIVEDYCTRDHDQGYLFQKLVKPLFVFDVYESIVKLSNTWEDTFLSNFMCCIRNISLAISDWNLAK